MCEPTLVLGALSAAVQYTNQRSANKRAEKALQRSEDRNDAYSQRAIKIVDENAQQYQQPTRDANLQAAEDSSVKSITSRLNEARDKGLGEISDTTQGRVSETYDATKARRALSQAKVADTIARLTAKVRAPGDLRISEGFKNAEASSDIGVLQSQRVNSARAGQIDAQNAARPNNFLSLVSGGLNAAAGAVGSTGPVANSTYGPIYKNARGTPTIPRRLFTP